MTVISQYHKHVYRILPPLGVCIKIPEDIQVWLKLTTISNVVITSKISTTVIDDNYTYIDEYSEQMYDMYPYSASIFPNKLLITYQRINFKYHFTSSHFGMITISYSYTYDAPQGVSAMISKMKLGGKTNTEIKAYFFDFLDTDVQQWIDDVDAGSATISATGTNTINFTLQNAPPPDRYNGEY